MKNPTDRFLFTYRAPSGWRIERGSGREVARMLSSFDHARTLLEGWGYVYRGADQWERDDDLTCQLQS